MLALTLGGGSAQNLWSDHLLQLIMLPLVMIGMINLFENRLGNISRSLVLLILLLLVFQFVPIGTTSGLPVFSGLESNWAFWAASPSRALESVIFTISILGLFLFIANLNDHQQERLIKFITLGFVINMLVGIIQLSYGAKVIISNVLPFDIASAMFANENHFSSLVYMVIPLFAWRFLATAWQPLVFIMIAFLIVLFQFAIGSRAGMAIATGLAMFSFFWFGISFVPLKVKQVILGLVPLIVLLGFYYYLTNQTQTGATRSVFFATIWQAIQNHWGLGTGLGSFVIIYPMYEAREEIAYVYANHAHSDFLELLLEVGIASIALFLLYAFQIIKHSTRSKLSQAAGLAILAVLLHSAVDYPLRTMAISTIFGILSAIILSQRPGQPAPSSTVFRS